jgi:hypothetical protein
MALPERWEVRIGDDDRNRIVDALRTHLGAGRLTLDEFEERTAQALAARTVGDLVPLTADLPDVRTRPAGPPVRGRTVGAQPRGAWDVLFRIHVAVWAVLSVFFVLLGLVVSPWEIWPIYPILGVGLSVGVHGAVKKAVQG